MTRIACLDYDLFINMNKSKLLKKKLNNKIVM